MAESTVLLHAYPGQEDEVLLELEEFPEVVAKRKVMGGVGDVALRLRADTREEIAHFISTTLRFLHGVRTVEEVQDADEYGSSVRLAIRDMRVP